MKDFIISMIFVLLIVSIPVLLPIVVATNGQLFTQRCEKAFPQASYVEQERCVDHFKNGGKIWEFK